MKISVIGSGYVGLVVGACFAESGNDVICVDKDKAKIRTLNRGRIPIYEPGLEELVRRNRAERRLTFSTDLAAAVRKSEVVFLAVGTPMGEDGSADLRHVLAAARAIGRAVYLGIADPDVRSSLEAIYQVVHGSLDGLDQFIDEEGRRALAGR
jgi:UDPglucose 6-dehydrogenase